MDHYLANIFEGKIFYVYVVYKRRFRLSFPGVSDVIVHL